ncbi:transposase [Micromonospora sp. NPDC051141]|uniref:transposase n=1 Tax=Micromonospora sp. NPDC051141 TaxID=3364284 RepID=UPI0037AE091C
MRRHPPRRRATTHAHRDHHRPRAATTAATRPEPRPSDRGLRRETPPPRSGRRTGCRRDDHPATPGPPSPTTHHDIADLDALITPLVTAINPALIATHGVGTETAGQLIVTAGDNPDRLRSEAAFAMLCGVAPLPASSGKTHRRRLNRGGDRHANCALWRIVITRLATDPRTRDYRDRMVKQKLSKPEIIRCLKRYVARETYQLLTQPTQRLDEP